VVAAAAANIALQFRTFLQLLAYECAAALQPIKHFGSGTIITVRLHVVQRPAYP